MLIGDASSTDAESKKRFETRVRRTRDLANRVLRGNSCWDKLGIATPTQDDGQDTSRRIHVAFKELTPKLHQDKVSDVWEGDEALRLIITDA